MVRIISFDLDNTLITSDFDDKVWLEEIPRLIARDRAIPFNEALDFAIGEYNRYRETVKWVDAEFYFKHFGLDGQWDRMVADLKHMIQPFGDSIRAIRKLSKKHDLIIVTGSHRSFLDAKLEVFKIQDYFKHIFSVPSDLGLGCKDYQVYEKVLDIMELKPSDIVHIGDNPESDLEAASKAGIRSFLLDRTGKRQGENIVKTLDEFVSIVESL